MSEELRGRKISRVKHGLSRWNIVRRECCIVEQSNEWFATPGEGDLHGRGPEASSGCAESVQLAAFWWRPVVL